MTDEPQGLYVGTSGWNYPEWKDSFYKGIARADWLAHLASLLPSVEVNGTFYGMPSEDSVRNWCERTPPHFRFAIKGHRFITHRKRLADVTDSVVKLRDAARPFGDKLAVVLWQLSPALHYDIEKLRRFSADLYRWRKVRHVLEFRDPSWFADDVAALLEEKNIAVCISDASDWPMWDRVTTDLVYVRLHGHTRTYRSSYRKTSLEKWADRAAEWLEDDRDVHIYFDNDGEGAAPRNAVQLLSMLV